MKYCGSVFVLLLLLTSCYLTGQSISVKQAKEDVDVFMDSLKRIHPESTAFVSQEILNKESLGIVDGVKSISCFELNIKIAELMAHVKDIHSFVSINIPKADNLNYFPLDIIVIDGKLYVKFSLLEEYDNLIGSRLISVENCDVDVVKEKMLKLIPGFNTKYKESILESDSFKVYLKYFMGDRSSFRIVLEEREGKKRTLDLKSIKAKNIRKAKKRYRAEVAGSHFKIRDGIGILKLVDFKNIKNNKKLINGSFKKMVKKGIPQLIIDVRDNDGGSTETAAEILKYLSDKKENLVPLVKCKVSREFKKMMKKRIPSLLRWLPLQNLDKSGRKIWKAEEGSLVDIKEDIYIKPVKESRRFKGKVYVLVNHGSLSQATIFPYYIRQWGLGSILGSETGSREDGAFGEVCHVRLPNSGIHCFIPTMVIKADIEKPYSSHGLKPDVVIRREIEPELKGDDSVLIQALKYVKSAGD